MANAIEELADLLGFGTLQDRTPETDRPKVRYRYPRFAQLFGRLLHERRLSEHEVRGLREDRLKSIPSFAKFLAEDTAA